MLSVVLNVEVMVYGPLNVSPLIAILDIYLIILRINVFTIYALALKEKRKKKKK